MIPIFARKDFPGFLSNLVTGYLMVDTPDGVAAAGSLDGGPYARHPTGSPQHQGATHEGDRKSGTRSGTAKTLKVEW